MHARIASESLPPLPLALKPQDIQAAFQFYAASGTVAATRMLFEHAIMLNRCETFGSVLEEQREAKPSRLKQQLWRGGFLAGLSGRDNGPQSIGHFVCRLPPENDSVNSDTNPQYHPDLIRPNVIFGWLQLTGSDSLASFSNFGIQTVALGAPGVSILSNNAEETSPFVR